MSGTVAIVGNYEATPTANPEGDVQVAVTSAGVMKVTGAGGSGGDMVDVNIGEVGGITVDPDAPAETNEVGTAATDRSGTITTGGAAQNAMAANTARREWTLINNSDTLMMVRIGGTASATAGIPVYAGDVVTGRETNAVSVYGATTGKAFTAWER